MNDLVQGAFSDAAGGRIDVSPHARFAGRRTSFLTRLERSVSRREAARLRGLRFSKETLGSAPSRSMNQRKRQNSPRTPDGSNFQPNGNPSRRGQKANLSISCSLTPVPRVKEPDPGREVTCYNVGVVWRGSASAKQARWRRRT